MTTPIFILSSGRSGTQMMEKLFSSFEDIEVHHEYLCNIIQPLGTKYFMGLINDEEVDKIIENTYGSAINLSQKSLWMDSSNKLSWIGEPLIRRFPNAKFIHMVRDGRRVVSSYFNKLFAECYDDYSTECLYNYTQNQSVEPPPEKKFWWPLIQHNGNYENFLNLNQFQKICLHWSEINKNIEKSLKTASSSNVYRVKLEDLVEKKEVYDELISFLNLAPHKDHFNDLKKPHNVHVPYSFNIEGDELEQFNEICGLTMKKYGYNFKKDYKVKY